MLLSGFCHRHGSCSLYSKDANTLSSHVFFFFCHSLAYISCGLECVLKTECLGWCDWEGGPSGGGVHPLGRLCPFSLPLTPFPHPNFHSILLLSLSFPSPLSFLIFFFPPGWESSCRTLLYGSALVLYFITGPQQPEQLLMVQNA